MARTDIGIKTIQLTMENRKNPFFLTVLWDAQDIVLVDTGLPGQMELIRAAFQEAGIQFEKLTKILMLDLSKIIAYHGGECMDNLQDRLQAILDVGPVENE